MPRRRLLTLFSITANWRLLVIAFSVPVHRYADTICAFLALKLEFTGFSVEDIIAVSFILP